MHYQHLLLAYLSILDLGCTKLSMGASTQGIVGISPHLLLSPLRKDHVHSGLLPLLLLDLLA
jgi:hypothetical protein